MTDGELQAIQRRCEALKGLLDQARRESIALAEENERLRELARRMLNIPPGCDPEYNRPECDDD